MSYDHIPRLREELASAKDAADTARAYLDGCAERYVAAVKEYVDAEYRLYAEQKKQNEKQRARDAA